MKQISQKSNFAEPGNRTGRLLLLTLLLGTIGAAFVLASAASAPARRHAPGLPVPAQTSGRITGTIYFRGEQPKLTPINMGKDPVCVSEHSGPVYPEDGRVNENGTLPNAFVYVESGTADLKRSNPPNSVELVQRGCLYEPHVLGLMVNQPLQVITLDPTTHNIHVTPKNNPDWNVTQQPGSPSVIHKFAHPEVMIPVHCNEHPWMNAYIGVVTNPFFAVTGKQGTFAIAGLPPGDYSLRVWTATFGTQGQKVVVRPNETSTADFDFTPR